MRLRVDGREIISNWTLHAPTTDKSPAIQLQAGRRYNIELEYFERGGGATSKLEWSYPGQARTFIPKSRLYSTTGTPDNTPPSVSLTSPAAGASFTAPATVELAADASDSDGTVVKVEFFQGATKLGEDTASPYTFTWQNVPAGSYSVSTKATDNAGASSTSGAVSVQVTAPTTPPTPPTPPTAGTGSGTGLKGEYFANRTFAAPAALTRTDPQVDFQWEDTGPAANLPANDFTVRWSGQVEAPVTGEYTFATISDDGVRVWINGQKVIDNWTDHGPTEDRAAPMRLAAGQKYDVRLEFYDKTGGATARLLWMYPGQALTTIPRPQLYPAGETALPPVSQAPNVSLTSPAAGASFTAPATVELAADASDSDGIVVKVEFFQGNTKLGEDTAGPYTFTWQNVPAGSYSVSAKATDDAGAFSASSVAAFTVNGAPEAKLPAPTNLTATGVWVPSCCGGQPMAHIALSWNEVPGAISYTIYRDGQFYEGEVLTPNFKDMPVPSGETHTYNVTAVDGRGESTRSNSATATAPSAPGKQDPGFTAPSNLRIRGIWQAGRATDMLAWDPVPGAVSYNIYQYDDRIVSQLPVTTCTVPSNLYWPGLTYTVTAVDASGQETIPSAPVSAQGALNPNERPGWMPDMPTEPRKLAATAEWNAGRPRIRLSWTGGFAAAYTFNIYRNGVRVAEGIWGTAYLDNNVQPGVEYTYSVSGVNVPWVLPVEGPLAQAVRARALTGAPAFTSHPVQITRVEPNDDSVKVHFEAVPGAADYRIYTTDRPGSKKYSGGGLSVEVNGLTPGKGAMVIVEAVDKLGPFQKMDGEMGPGSMDHAGMMNMTTNGLGDPSNVPNVIARSPAFLVTPVERNLTGEQVFFDKFRGSKPFVKTQPPASLLSTFPNDVQAWENDRWSIFNVKGDLLNTRVFVMSNHFMETLYDGGTPRSGSPAHTQIASLVMKPKANADISGGKVLHVTFEVDPHFGRRRWCDVMVTEAGDPLLDPSNFDVTNSLPTVSGNVFRWEIQREFHAAQLWSKLGQVPQALRLLDLSWGPNNDRGIAGRMQGETPLSNGTMADLDNRVVFDLYLSRNRYRLVENGRVVVDRVFPNGATLPFSKMDVYFVHQVYHTGLERAENLPDTPNEPYWINYRPWADERHWDNMGFAVLNSFPQ